MKTASMKSEQKGPFYKLCRSTSMKPQQNGLFSLLQKYFTEASAEGFVFTTFADV